jgi:hypothetical protein
MRAELTWLAHELTSLVLAGDFMMHRLVIRRCSVRAELAHELASLVLAGDFMMHRPVIRRCMQRES